MDWAGLKLKFMTSKFKIFNIQKFSQFKSSPKLYAVITNTGWLFADRILRMGASLLVGVWVARYLGVKQYGIFNYAYAFVALFSSFATLGLDSVVVHRIVRDQSSKEVILGTAFRLRLFGGLLAVLLTIISIFFLRPSDSTTIALVAILSCAGIFQAFDTIDLWFQSQVQSKYTVVAKNIAFFLVTLLKVSLILTKAPLLAFAWATLAEFILSSVGLAIAYRVSGNSLKLWRWSFQTAKVLFKEGLPLILSGITIMIYMKIDQIMLGEMIGSNAVGIYSAATRISEIWYFIPTAICSSVAPSIYAAKEKSESLYYQRIRQLLRLLNLIALAIALPMTFLSGTVINLLFGDGYTEAGQILSIHIWASLFVFMGVATSSWFVAEGLTHLSFRRTLIGAITNVILNLILIPKYAGVGAATATVISQAFASFLSNSIHYKTHTIFIIQFKSLFLAK
jgi:polysaccharide transporter, PST family